MPKWTLLQLIGVVTLIGVFCAVSAKSIRMEARQSRIIELEQCLLRQLQTGETDSNELLTTLGRRFTKGVGDEPIATMHQTPDGAILELRDVTSYETMNGTELAFVFVPLGRPASPIVVKTDSKFRLIEAHKIPEKRMLWRVDWKKSGCSRVGHLIGICDSDGRDAMVDVVFVEFQTEQ